MTTPPPHMPDEDYEAIEAAVMDTARGRWFLAEFARRNRTADTALLLGAIERLESLLAARDAPAVAALPAPTTKEPPATPERQAAPAAELPAPSTPASSAEAELFALEEPDTPCVILPLQHADDVVWQESGSAEPEPAVAPAVRVAPVADGAPDRGAGSEAAGDMERERAGTAALADTEPDAELFAAEEAAPARSEPSAGAVLTPVQPREEKAVARAAEPSPPPPPPSYTPQPVSFAEIDALTFEEKSVYFA